MHACSEAWRVKPSRKKFWKKVGKIILEQNCEEKMLEKKFWEKKFGEKVLRKKFGKKIQEKL